LRNNGFLTAYADFEREVVIVPEPLTNKLLISATPRFYPDVMRLIEELDSELPQVVIQVLIAEVDLNNLEEFGVEIGLQSPVLFQRSNTGLSTLAQVATATGAATTSSAINF